MHFWHSLDILSIAFAERFRRSIMVTWLKRFEHCQNLSCAIQVCQLWFNIVKRDLTEESLGQRAWSQLWQGTPISEHCGPWWPQYSRHCGHYYATKVNPATLHCDQAKVYYGVLLSSTNVGILGSQFLASSHYAFDKGGRSLGLQHTPGLFHIQHPILLDYSCNK